MTVVPATEVKGKVRFAVLTIKPEEFKAVLRRFGHDGTTWIQGSRLYAHVQVVTQKQETIDVAIVRCVDQGNIAAQDVTRDVIDDLDPAWILVCGIAGAAPTTDFCLGDVVLGTQVLDFTVEELKKGKSAFSLQSRATHHDVEDFLSAVPGLEVQYGEWNVLQNHGGEELPPPTIDTSPDKLYGNPKWKDQVLKALEKRKNRTPSRPKLVTASIGSSDKLLKDTDTLALLKRVSRQIQCVEMESAGAYVAARGRGATRKSYPVLTIRGISDVVGHIREDDWTAYACESAAAFAKVFVGSGYVPGPSQNPTPPIPPDLQTAKWKAIISEWVDKLDLDNWYRWTSRLMAPEPQMSRELGGKLSEAQRWMFAVSLPDSPPAVVDAFHNFLRVLAALNTFYGKNSDAYGTEGGSHLVRRVKFLRGWDPERYEELRALDDEVFGLHFDLVCELTRAANHFVSQVQQFIWEDFRLAAEPATLVQSDGIDNRYLKPRYQTTDIETGLFVSIEDFENQRASRDYFFGGLYE